MKINHGYSIQRYLTRCLYLHFSYRHIGLRYSMIRFLSWLPRNIRFLNWNSLKWTRCLYFSSNTAPSGRRNGVDIKRKLCPIQYSRSPGRRFDSMPLLARKILCDPISMSAISNFYRGGPSAGRHGVQAADGPLLAHHSLQRRREGRMQVHVVMIRYICRRKGMKISNPRYFILNTYI